MKLINYGNFTTSDVAEFYNTSRNDWNSDVHLISTYAVAGRRRIFAQQSIIC